jgi:O-antigen/teichoic acid export membrane protein
LEYIRASGQKIKRYMMYWCAALVFVAGILLLMGDDYGAYGILMILVALGLPAYALIGLDVCVGRALGKVTQSQIPESLYLQAIVALGVGVTVLSNMPSVEITLAIQASAAWIVLLIYRMTIVRVSPDETVNDGSMLNLAPVHDMAASTIKGMMATALAARAPVIILALVATAEMVGLFEGALRFALLATIPVWAVGVVVSPMISSAATNSDFEKIHQLYAVAGVLQTIPALTALVVLVVFGDVLLFHILGESFQIAYSAMIIIAIATVINAVGSVASSYLLMTGGEKAVQTYSVWSLVVVVVGIPVGAILAGLEGAAWSLVLRSLVRDIGLTIVVAKTRELMPWMLSVKEIKWMLGELAAWLRNSAVTRR